MGLEQIHVELHESMGSDATWKMLVDSLDQVNFDLEYNELSHIRFRFHFHVPIFVSRQYMRHRNQSPNEMSGRYRTMPDEFYWLPEDVIEIYRKIDDKTAKLVEQEWYALHDKQYSWYKSELDLLKQMEKSGVITNTEYKRAREVLRGILGTSYFTDIVATWDLNNLIKFLKLRLDEHAQLEIQDMAQQVYFEIAESGAVPEVLEYLRNNGLTFNPL
jgi:thymidylate synthase (FAD)